MTLAHLGHAPWGIVLMALLYLVLAAGIGIGMVMGKRSQRPPAQKEDAVVRRIHSA